MPFGLTFNSYAQAPENLYKYNGKEEQKETGWLDYGLRQYDPALMRWHIIDPSADRYHAWSPYSYVFNNPISFIDPDGADPIDPRTGAEYQVDLWKSGVYAVDRSRNNPDRSLLANISRPFPLNNYPRTVDGAGGSWAEGATTVPMRDRVWPLTTQSSKDFVDNSINSSWDRKPLVAPNDYLWKQAANSGTYSFVDNIQAEGMFYSDISSYSVKTVEDNYITQSIDLSRNGDGNFEISSITNFDTKVGDVQTETKETRRGTKTTSYRTLSVTETTYTFNNGEVSESTRTYERRQRVRDN